MLSAFEYLMNCLGFFISSLAFWFLSTIFRPPGIGQGTKTHNEDELILPTAYRQDCPTQGKYSVPIDGVPIRRESESVKSNSNEGKSKEVKEVAKEVRKH